MSKDKSAGMKDGDGLQRKKAAPKQVDEGKTSRAGEDVIEVNKTERALLGKRDIWLLGGVVALAAIIYGAFYFFGGQADVVTAQITVDGVMVREVNLSKDEEFALEQNPRVHFQVRRGAIAFIESDCPDKVCIHSGFLDTPGQTAACLPNKVLLYIYGEDKPSEPYDENEMDVIAQ
jgi:hypothetical protein